jgi:hypothetical protein
MFLDQTSLDKMLLDEMSLDQTTLYKTTLYKTSLDKTMLDERTWSHFYLPTTNITSKYRYFFDQMFSTVISSTYVGTSFLTRSVFSR